MLAEGFQKWLLGIQKSKVVITSKIGGDGGVGGGRTIISGYGGTCDLGGFSSQFT